MAQNSRWPFLWRLSALDVQAAAALEPGRSAVHSFQTGAGGQSSLPARLRQQGAKGGFVQDLDFSLAAFVQSGGLFLLAAAPARGTERRRHPGRLFQTRRYKPPPAARRIRSPAGAAQAPRREVCRTRPAVRCHSPSARRPTPCDAVGGSIRSSAPLRSHPPPPPAAPRPAPAQGLLSQSPALPVPSCFSPVPPVCTKSSYNYYTAAGFI